jgi:hypothetical protein
VVVAGSAVAVVASGDLGAAAALAAVVPGDGSDA